ncbi:TPA: DUF551 domain-containing protein [Enterobacter hormaechei subsp. xiangfangensis]|nr:DUF551 domain-containing protein [Enterobacter hormaechei subsp. xiangfangensis]
MITLTKEWLLKTIAELEEERDATPGAVNEDAAKALAAMKIALASLEAEAVGEVVLGEYDDCGCHPDAKVVCIADDGQADWENFKDGTRLYTAPPAPVSVPAAMEMDDDFDSAFEHGKAVGWNACRAAMLQGAEPVTTDYKLPFDQWLSQQTGTIDVECGCVMTEVFFHWLRVAYEAGNSPVIPDGWVACSERMPEVGSKVIVFRPSAEESNDPPVKTATYKGGREYYHGFDCYCEPTHWMPLPAAPQQEVK